MLLGARWGVLRRSLRLLPPSYLVRNLQRDLPLSIRASWPLLLSALSSDNHPSPASLQHASPCNGYASGTRKRHCHDGIQHHSLLRVQYKVRGHFWSYNRSMASRSTLSVSKRSELRVLFCCVYLQGRTRATTSKQAPRRYSEASKPGAHEANSVGGRLVEREHCNFREHMLGRHCSCIKS